jgi:hypothetical protein
VPFVRFARDKRGYEYVYLVHDSTRGGGRPQRPVVLYWYRTPPGVKVGRPPFDEEVRQRLEAQNPEIRFDWRAITSAQPPPPDAEQWRERRRAEKAAKLARLTEERDEPDDQADEEENADHEADVIVQAPEARANEPAVPPALEPATAEESAAVAADSPAEGTGSEASAASPARSRRRRRGRRRRHRPGVPEAGAAPAAPSAPAADEAATERAVPDQDGPDDAEDSGPEEPEDS